jgi:D-3-phosphoglycerate dehydrogenase / 2-oxoglutarate reductase
VDQDAFLRALESGKLRAAGVDVLEGEPDIAGHPLVEYAKRNKNLMITPHIGGFSPDALATVLDFSARKAMEALAARA